VIQLNHGLVMPGEIGCFRFRSRGATVARANIGKTEIRATEGLPRETTRPQME